MIRRIPLFLLSLITITSFAGSPVWTFTPLSATSVVVANNGTAIIQYLVTNQSTKAHTLVMQDIHGVTQVTSGVGVCTHPFALSGQASCTLTLIVDGSQLTSAISDGPIVCQQGGSNMCYRPSQSDVLDIKPAPSNCTDTGDGNIQCTEVIDGQTNYGFTNMTYALCRSAQCPYSFGAPTVSCSCTVIVKNQGIDSASVAPNDYNTSKPIGFPPTQVTSTYSQVNSSTETPTNCAAGPFANCFGATCTVSGGSATCTCPVEVSTFIAPHTNCDLGPSLIWSATSVGSFPAIEGTMLFIYDNFFGGNVP